MNEAEKKRRREVLDALAHYQAKGSDEAVPEALERILALETDRALVTIIGSFLEDALLNRILSELPKGNQNRKALLKGGPLRSVEHRIALARAMGIVSEHNAARLDVYRAMRNACAHSRLDISFETPELLNALALVMPDSIAKNLIEGLSEGTVRGLFVGSAAVTLNMLQGIGRAEMQALADQATDEHGSVHADKVLLATLLGKSNNKPAPGPPPAPKGKKLSRPPRSSRP